MTLTFETVVQSMSDLRHDDHEPAYLLVDASGGDVLTDGGADIPIEPSDMTVGELKDAVAEIENSAVLNDILTVEANGKDRKTAKDAIEAQLDGITTISEDEPSDESAQTESPTTQSTSSPVEDDVRKIETLTVIETATPLPVDVSAVLFGEAFEGRVLIE